MSLLRIPITRLCVTIALSALAGLACAQVADTPLRVYQSPSLQAAMERVVTDAGLQQE
jgi:hypothetical protein